MVCFSFILLLNIIFIPLTQHKENLQMLEEDTVFNRQTCNPHQNLFTYFGFSVILWTEPSQQVTKCLAAKSHRSHRRNSARPPLMCHQRWRPHECHCGAVGARRRTGRRRGVHGSESERRSEPAGGPEGCRHETKEYIEQDCLTLAVNFILGLLNLNAICRIKTDVLPQW